MERSHRVPGYSYRRSGINDLKEYVERNASNYNVHGDALNGNPVRVPTSRDADLADDTNESAPLG